MHKYVFQGQNTGVTIFNLYFRKVAKAAGQFAPSAVKPTQAVCLQWPYLETVIALNRANLPVVDLSFSVAVICQVKPHILPAGYIINFLKLFIK